MQCVDPIWLVKEPERHSVHSLGHGGRDSLAKRPIGHASQATPLKVFPRGRDMVGDMLGAEVGAVGTNDGAGVGLVVGGAGPASSRTNTRCCVALL